MKLPKYVLKGNSQRGVQLICKKYKCSRYEELIVEFPTV